jgi:hypothetical protein
VGLNVWLGGQGVLGAGPAQLTTLPTDCCPQMPLSSPD